MRRVIIGGRYSVKERLGAQGNMSRTLKCSDLENDDEESSPIVVVKLLERPADSDEDLAKQVFQREVESLKKVANHPNVVKILDYGYDDEYNDDQGAYYIVLEFIAGKNLKEANANGIVANWTYQEKLQVIDQLFDGMDYIHRMGVVHRDVKPANIMVSSDIQTKIIDFGISKLTDEFYSEYTTSNYYTELYSSPEQKNGEMITNQSDIYSLGIVLYEILRGRKFEKTEQFDFESISPEFQSIITKMTAQNRENRYRSLSEVKNDFIKMLHSQMQVRYLHCTFLSKEEENPIFSTLYNYGLVSAPSRDECIPLLRREFQFDCRIALCPAQGKYEEAYWIYGRQVRAKVAIARFDPQDFHGLLIQVSSFDSAQFIDQKEQAMPLDDDIEIIVNPSPIYDQYKRANAEEIVEKLHVREASKLSGHNQRIEEYDIIDKWSKILSLLRKKLDTEKSAIKYTEFSYDENEGTLTVAVADDDQGNDIQENFTRDTMLQMSRKNSKSSGIDVGYLRYYKQGKMVIDISETDIDSIAETGTVSISKRKEESSISKQEKAIKAVKYREMINPDVADALFDPKHAVAKRNIELFQSDFCSSHIDIPKKISLEKALGAESIFLLQGPPGTGKTTFITELVYQIIHGNRRYPGNPSAKILIASQSHVAVDNALSGIKELIPDLRMIRIGRDEKIADSSKDFTLDAYCHSWANNVCEKCDNALAAFKKDSGVNDELQIRHGLVQKIEEIKQQSSELQERVASIEMEIDKTSFIVDKWHAINSSVEKMRQMLSDSASDLTEDLLLSMMSRVSDELSDLGLDLKDKIDETMDISTKRTQLFNQRDELQMQLKRQSEEEVQAKVALGVDSDIKYLQVKDSILDEVAQKEKVYTLYAKVENLVQGWKEHIGKGQGLLEESLMDATLIGSTCLGLSRLERVDFHFDWVIIDEAGKATPSELMVPMCLGQRIVLVGDHKQLPPVVDQELLNYQENSETAYKKEDLETSLFEYLAENLNDDCKGMLTDQYRMHPAIGTLVSQIFYHNELRSKSNAEDKRLPISMYEGKPLVWLNTSSNPRKKEESIGNNSVTYRNPLEVEIIFGQLKAIEKELIDKGINEDISVAVIAGYSAQKDLIIRRYESEYKDQLNHLQIEINTVDAFQGRETDVVFYSIVRSNPKGAIGFLKDARRLNVAFSRARKQLIIVGDLDSVTRSQKLANNPNPFYKVKEYFNRNPETCIIERV